MMTQARRRRSLALPIRNRWRVFVMRHGIRASWAEWWQDLVYVVRG